MAAALHTHPVFSRSHIRASERPASPDRQRPSSTRIPASTPASSQPRNFSLRSSTLRAPPPSAVAAASAPSSTPPTIEERKRQAQEDKNEHGPWRVTEVDSAEQQEFYPAPVVGVCDVAPGVRCITVEAEVSREFVPLDKAHTKPGQQVLIRVGNKAPSAVPVSSAPIPGHANFPVLYKLRGDIPAGSTKAPQYALSVKGPLDLHVQRDTHPHLFDLSPGDSVEVGQFTSTGMDLRPIMFLSRFPTLLIFAAGPGPGIATARSLIEAEDVGSLYTELRSDVRLYYHSQHLAYQEWFPNWEKVNVKVRPGEFAAAFDDDDLEYDPETTGAVVCGDAKSNAAALRVLEDAGVSRSSIIVWQCQ